MVLKASIAKLPLMIFSPEAESINLILNRPLCLMEGAPSYAQTTLSIGINFESSKIAAIMPCRKPPDPFLLGDTCNRSDMSR